MEHASDARVVLIGEATHGTQEFYEVRADITRRLLQDHGFSAVAVEADWPDAYRVNRWVKGSGDDRTADEALCGFRRFPTWMWRNAAVVEFVQWLRGLNESLPSDPPRGFYGLDLYSLFASIEAVLAYLDRFDPEAGARARSRYSCFDHFGGEAENYALMAGSGEVESCEEQVIQQLMSMSSDGPADDEDLFEAQQNARLVRNAEEYYRTMFRAGISSWNLRDRHMFETLQLLIEHLERRIPGAKVVVWAHNSHVGDARATEMGWQGEVNIGQFTRQWLGPSSFLIGFSTFDGSVLAASSWGAEPEIKAVRPALPGSIENLLHASASKADVLLGDELKALPPGLLERAIGVIYRPETERQSHYFRADVASQFDSLIHIDRTSALTPLETVQPDTVELPETFPSEV